ncbi:transcription initiation factor IIE subunit beta-like [Trichoplusia ni]|uniref:Transcription initiation factor IIE subunit beta-like n=1 Tax=Trichoplusia ni TaxID=7111 RepID=A0A7E5W7S0_TRINI|nr:transcription initiation factor IIE subunit beta-like [Trichoplusia ni]
MDPALLREREAFKKKALATPSIEKKKKDESQFKDDSKKKSKSSSSSASTGPKLDASNYKTMSGSSSYRFGVLARIVRHMRARHQEGDDHPLTLDEVLDETNQLDLSNKVKQVGTTLVKKSMLLEEYCGKWDNNKKTDSHNTLLLENKCFC